MKYSDLNNLLLEKHIKVHFISTVFSDPKCTPFKSCLGGDCLDQINFLFNLCRDQKYNPKILAFDKPNELLEHFALSTNISVKLFVNYWRESEYTLYGQQ